MLCDECNQSPATVFLTQLLDGVRTLRKLCGSCAAPILGQTPPTDSVESSSWPPLDPKIFERPPDCPLEVTISDPVIVRDLATVLHAPFYRVIAVLMQHNIFTSLNSPIDFTSASLVCTHFGVTPHKAA
jgi:hypothetical protein